MVRRHRHDIEPILRIARKPEVVEDCECCPWCDYLPENNQWDCEKLKKPVNPDTIDENCPLPIYSGTYPENEL